MPGAMRGREPLINSVDLILKHGHELALTDSQVTRLTAVKATQDSTLAVLKARLDSLGGRRGRGEDQGSAGVDDGGPSAMQPRMQERGEAMVAYRHALESGRDAAFAVLEKKQRKQAEKLEKELKKAMQESEPTAFGRGEQNGYKR
jgi:LTXXQ motif family protein